MVRRNKVSGDQQHNRRRHLPGDQHATPSSRSSTFGAAFAIRGESSDACVMERRQHTEEQSRADRRAEGARQDSRIHDAPLGDVRRGAGGKERWPAAGEGPRTQSQSQPPPPAAKTALSASSWQIRRKWLAPSAARIASSRVRALPRASNRFATFAHPIRSTANAARPRSARYDLVSRAMNSSRYGSDRDPPSAMGLRLLARELRADRVHLRACLLERYVRLQTRCDQ